MSRPNPDLRPVTVAHPGTCRTCGGLGRLGVTYDAAVGGYIADEDCPTCDGRQTAKGLNHD